jgi:hypothetical protein
MIAGYNGGLNTERTEFLPNGLDPRGTLQVTSRLEDAVMASNTQTGKRRLMNAMMLGMSMSRPAGTGGKSEGYDKYRPVVQGNYGFLFRLSQRARLSRSLSDTWFNGNLPPVAYEQLPADFRQKAETAKSQFGNVKFEAGRPRNVPPP